MTDGELRAYFGLSERALFRLKLSAGFPQRDSIIIKTDSKAVDDYFDQRAGLASQATTGGMVHRDGTENFD